MRTEPPISLETPPPSCESLFCLVEQNSTDLLWTKFGTDMAEFDGDHEAFGKLCDLVIGKSLEGLVLFFF